MGLPPQCTKSLPPLLLLPQLLLLVFLMESVPSPLLEDILMLDFLMLVSMLVSLMPVSQLVMLVFLLVMLVFLLVMLVSHTVSLMLDSQWLPQPRLNKQTSSFPRNQINSERYVSNDQNFPLIVRVK